MNHGQSEDLESVKSEVEVEELPEAPDRLEQLYKLIENQNNAILLLTGKMAEMTVGLDKLEKGQNISDKAIIEVAKKAGGGGGSGGAGNLLAQIMPYLTQSRGPSPLEKIANQMFIRNIAFTSLTTERLAKKQFGDEYSKMVKDMETDLIGSKTE